MNNYIIEKEDSNGCGCFYTYYTSKYYKADFCNKSTFYYDAKGNYHHLELPAISYNSGTKQWYKHSDRHRVGGPAFDSLDLLEWYKNNQRHRLNAPAFIKNNYKEYWEFGKFIL